MKTTSLIYCHKTNGPPNLIASNTYYLKVGQGFKNQLAAAKSLQSCPTLCEPIDGSPSGSTVPEILQARTPEWVALSFSNAWKWKVKVKWLSRVRLLVTPRTAAYQPPPSMGFSRQEYWSGVPLPSPKNQLSWVILTQSLLWSCSQGGDLGFWRLAWGWGAPPSSLTWLLGESSVPQHVSLSTGMLECLQHDICLGRVSDERERDRETHPERQRQREKSTIKQSHEWTTSPSIIVYGKEMSH